MRGLWQTGLAAWGAMLALGASAQLPPGTPLDPDDPLSTGTAVLIVAPENPVPSNGLFLLWLSDLEVERIDPRPLVQVSRTAGGTTRTFGGTVRRVRGPYWAWKAAEPLEPGEYLVSIAHAFFGSSSATITVVGEAALEPPALVGELRAEVASLETRHAFCREEDSEHSEAPLFPTHEGVYAFVHPEARFSADAMITQQFLYRLVTGDLDFRPFRSFDAIMPAGPFTRRADEYCVRVEAMDIATSTVHAFPDELCAPDREELGELGERRLPVTDEQLNRYTCALPPEGLEERWCERNAGCIEVWENEALIELNGCQHYFEVCPDAERPDAGASGTGGAGGRIDIEPDDLEPPDAGPIERSDGGASASSSSGGRGCSIAGASKPAPFGLAALALLALSRVRRATNRSAGG